MTVISKVYEILGKFYTHYPVIILLIVTLIGITLTWIGLANSGLPAFGDPYLGFQTRFTSIANRLITLENFRTELNSLNLLENYPGERLGERELKRRALDSRRGTSMCANTPLDDYARVALELRGDAASPVLKRETLSLVCYFQQMIASLPSYGSVCEYDESGRCCAIWSLPTYVAQFSNKSDCAQIGDQDLQRFSDGLIQCNSFYSNATQQEDCQFRRSSCPQWCRYGEVLHSAHAYTIERDAFLKNASQYALIILPVPKSKDQSALEELQRQIWALRRSLPQSLVTLAGYDFGGKNSIFETYLVSDLHYVGVGSVIIFSIVLIFTKSMFVTVVSFGMLLLSLGIAYFVYNNVFSIPYFPFMNMLVTIIILGIGTDTTLIVSAAWTRLHATAPTQREFVMTQTLAETTPTLVITTCTTAAAFLASLMSSITTIKCFSIFAGIAIITSFILLYITVPLSLDCSARFWSYVTFLFPPPAPSKVFKTITGSSALSKSLKKLGNTRICRTGAFFGCSSAVVAAAIFMFWIPGLKLPETEQFQLLAASHPAEVYERQVSPVFGDLLEESKVTLYFVWGLVPVDNGSGLNPSNLGQLQFDQGFSVDSPDAQKLLRRLCKRVQKLKYYDPIENALVGLNLDGCFMDTFLGWMKRDCRKYAGAKPCCNSSKFPYNNETLTRCMGLAARDLYRTPSLYFRTDIAGPKWFLSRENGHGTLATLTVRVRTNVTWSMNFAKMNTAYEEFEESFVQLVKDAPPELSRGFVISSHLDFYDLQKSLSEDTSWSMLLSVGLCFVFLLVATRQLTVAVGAAVTIVAIFLVTSGVMIKFFDWKLGVFESIAATVAVGLSDFTAHHAIAYGETKSMGKITSATFFSAVATVVMGLSLYAFSSVLVYQQIGSFFFVLVATSWVFSICFLKPVLHALDCVTEWIFGTALGHNHKAADEPGSDDDVHSCSDLIVENPNVQESSMQMLEKFKELKLLGQETSV